MAQPYRRRNGRILSVMILVFWLLADLKLAGKTAAASATHALNSRLLPVLSHQGNNTQSARDVAQKQASARAMVTLAMPTIPAGSTNLILSNDFVTAPMSESDKEGRWQQGLPVPLSSVADETTFPRAFTPWQGASAAATKPLTLPISTTVNSVDGWLQRAEETLEQPAPSAGDCQWRTGHNTTKADYAWGRADTRQKTGSYAAWPSGMPTNGAPALPANSPYADNGETWWQCELTQTRTVHNVAVEFELWLELDNSGDHFEVRFYDAECALALPDHYRNGLLWQGTTQGLANRNNIWRNYRVTIPGLQSSSNNKLCIEFKFTSDQIDGNYPAAQGPWLDNVQVWDYEKPASSADCQTKDPTVTLVNAPGAGLISKGLVVPPYTDDIKAGAVDNAGTHLDIAGMVERLKAADVHWVRLEFTLPPADLMRSGTDLGPQGVSHVDLRHYDRLVDMLCANAIAVLALVDYQTLARQDWHVNTSAYIADFTAATRQLATYFQDRIRYWEVWNEPNFALSGIDPGAYAQLLIATYDTIKAIEADDKVVFAGLAQATGQVAGNSNDYFGAVSLALGARQNPAPYDVFALHPYPSNEYTVKGKVVVDPSIYLRWEQPTTIHKFFTTMTQNGKENQPIWITEMGWNRAADSTNPITKACPAVNQTMVTGSQQALYAVRSFDILFKETGWSATIPAVNKIFWYQYADVAIPASACAAAIAAGSTPASLVAYRTNNAAPSQAADWWFGLYSGIDWSKGGVIEPNGVQCAFRQYPMNTASATISCRSLVYLPLIQNGVSTSR